MARAWVQLALLAAILQSCETGRRLGPPPRPRAWLRRAASRAVLRARGGGILDPDFGPLFSGGEGAAEEGREPTIEDLDAIVNAPEEGDDRPVRVGWVPFTVNEDGEDEEESVRVVPARDGCLLGSDGKGWHEALAEWYPCTPAAWMPPRRQPLPPIGVRVPQDFRALHAALKALAAGSSASVLRGVYRWDGAIKVRKGVGGEGEAGSGGVHVLAEAGTEAWGRWLLGRRGGGSFSGLQCRGNMSDLEGPLIDVRHGPWHFDSMLVACAGGQALLGMEWCEVRADSCAFGGLGADFHERAAGALVLLGRSHVLLKDCIVHHAGCTAGKDVNDTMHFGVLCAEDAHCHVVGSEVRDNDVGAGVRDCGSMVVAASRFVDNRESALYAQAHEEDESSEEDAVRQASAHRGHAQNGSAMVLVGSWTNTRTWFHCGRPSALNNYIFEGWRVALREPHEAFPARSEEAMKLLVEADPSLFPDPYTHRYAYEHPRAFRRDGSRRDDWFLHCYNCGEKGHWGAACPYGQRPLLERHFAMVDPEWARLTGEIDYLENIDCRVPKPNRTVADLVAEWNRKRNREGDSEEEQEAERERAAVAGEAAPPPLGGRVRWSELRLCSEWAPPLPGGGVGPWQVAPHPLLGPEKGDAPEHVGDGTAEGFQAYLTPDAIRRRNAFRADEGKEPLPASAWPAEIVRLWNLYNPTKPFRSRADPLKPSSAK